jgi:hypothetical protein
MRYLALGDFIMTRCAPRGKPIDEISGAVRHRRRHSATRAIRRSGQAAAQSSRANVTGRGHCGTRIVTRAKL